MFKTLSPTVAVTALLAAQASTAEGLLEGDWYGSLFGGYATSDLVTSYATGAYSVDVTIAADGGYIIGGVVGMYVGANIRTEAEFSYARYNIGSYGYDVSGPFLNDTTSGPADDGVAVTATYLMGNIWYDFTQLAPEAGLIPYAGGGLGYALIEGTSDTGDLFEPTQSTAYQFGGGVQVTAGPGLIDFAYRFRGMTGADIVTPAFAGDGSGTGHSFQAGYMLKF